MPLLVVDLLLGLLAVVLLSFVGYGLYHRVRALLRTVSAAGERVTAATPEMPNR